MTILGNTVITPKLHKGLLGGAGFGPPTVLGVGKNCQAGIWSRIPKGTMPHIWGVNG